MYEVVIIAPDGAHYFRTGSLRHALFVYKYWSKRPEVVVQHPNFNR